MKTNKIYILGTSGSGKTFLADKLSKGLEIPNYDLDDIFWYKKYTKKHNKEIRKRKLKEIIRKRKWIIEGVFGSWVEDAIKKSDLVIWLDPPFRIISWRIFKRVLIKKVKNREAKETWKDCFGLIKYASKYKKGKHSSSYQTHKEIIEKHKVNFIILKNKKQVKKFLKDILKLKQNPKAKI